MENFKSTKKKLILTQIHISIADVTSTLEMNQYLPVVNFAYNTVHHDLSHRKIFCTIKMKFHYNVWQKKITCGI